MVGRVGYLGGGSRYGEEERKRESQRERERKGEMSWFLLDVES